MSEIDIDSALSKLLQLGNLVTPIAVRTANSMGIAEHFEASPITSEALSKKLLVREKPLRRLLLALVEVGLLSITESGAFTLSDLGKVLRNDHPLSMHDAYKLAETDIQSWAHLTDSLRTGVSGFECAYGETHRTYRSKNIEEDVRMDKIHQAATRLDLLTLSRAFPWAEFQTIIDIGGGTGTFLAGILDRFPELQGTLFDLPRMVENAPTIIEKFNVADRCRIVGGDFFKQIPSDGDLYILKAVVGGWDDASCLQILSKIHEAMRKDSKLLIIEPVSGIGKKFARSNVVQLSSMVLYGGTYRAIEDYEKLAELSSFKIQNIIPRSTLPILELIPIRKK